MTALRLVFNIRLLRYRPTWTGRMQSVIVRIVIGPLMVCFYPRPKTRAGSWITGFSKANISENGIKYIL